MKTIEEIEAIAGTLSPAFEQYRGEDSFFGGAPPLPKSMGYVVVLGFGVLFSIITTILVFLNKYFGMKGDITSEHFKYASGATIQILLFGVLAISLKKVAPSAHTFAEIVKVRWGTAAHFTFLFFGFCANIIVTSMLLLGGAATVEALTGMDYKLASFLIPWGVILYTASGGLQATFLASYLHTTIIFGVLVMMIFLVYVKVYSSDQIYDMLSNTVSKTDEQCEAIFSYDDGETFFEKGKYACGPIEGNNQGSSLTMASSGGLMFGIINIVGNFGTVFVDQSYWQSAIAARPQSAARGYLLGGIIWFTIPFSLATSLGLASTALQLPITADEAGAGLVPPAVATHLLGKAGASLILVMLFMAIVSTGSAESIAVSSLIAYDFYREYFNPEATGEQILFVSRVVIVVFGLFMGAFAIVLNLLGLNLGWVYLFMGVVIGSAVIPLWNMMTWKKASGTGAVIAAWSGFFLAVTGWLIAAKIKGGSVSVDTLGENVVMLSGNLIAIISSGVIHFVYSYFIDPQDYDFAEMEKGISLVEDDRRGLTEEEQNPEELLKAERWITRRGYALALILAVIWPVLSLPAGVFSRSYFAFWVLLAIAWGFGGALTITILPLTESSEEILRVLDGLYNYFTGTEPTQVVDPKELYEDKPTKVEEPLVLPDDTAKSVDEPDEVNA